MNLYLVSQEENNDYDTFDSFVVVAESEEEAKKYNPAGIYIDIDKGTWTGNLSDTWASIPDNVDAELIGTADKKYEQGTIIIASFNAG